MNPLKKYREYLILFYIYLKNKQIEEASSLFPTIRYYEKIILQKFKNITEITNEDRKIIQKLSRILFFLEKKIQILKKESKKSYNFYIEEEIEFLIKKFLEEKGLL